MAADMFTKAFNNCSRWREVLDLIGITVIDGVPGVEVVEGGRKSKKGWSKVRFGSDGGEDGSDSELVAGDSVSESDDLSGDVGGCVGDGDDCGDDTIPCSHFPAIIARCALRSLPRTTCAISCVFAMAPRKYQKFGEEAKASPKSAKAKASQARTTPSPRGKAPALGDPKAFPPLGAAGVARPPPPPVPKSFASSGAPPATGGVAKAGSSGDPPAVPLPPPPLVSLDIGPSASLSGDPPASGVAAKVASSGAPPAEAIVPGPEALGGTVDPSSGDAPAGGEAAPEPTAEGRVIVPPDGDPLAGGAPGGDVSGDPPTADPTGILPAAREGDRRMGAIVVPNVLLHLARLQFPYVNHFLRVHGGGGEPT